MADPKNPAPSRATQTRTSILTCVRNFRSVILTSLILSTYIPSALTAQFSRKLLEQRIPLLAFFGGGIGGLVSCLNSWAVSSFSRPISVR